MAWQCQLSTGENTVARERVVEAEGRACGLTSRPLLDVIAGCPNGRHIPPSGLAPFDARGLQEANMKRTYQASKVRRARTHGFLVRMKSRGGRAVINARRAKGRKRLAV
jgi:large subunit ribosomal protein L34